MAAVALSACTVSNTQVGGCKMVVITTAGTVSHGDTIDVSSLFTNGCFSWVGGGAIAAAVTADKYGDKTVTIPGAGGAAARYILCMGD